MANKSTVKKKTTQKKAVVVAAVVAKGAQAAGAAVVAGAGAKGAKAAGAAASAGPGPKAKKRIYTKKRLTALLDSMLTQFADQLSGKPLSYSAGDGLKMMQMREHAEPERPTEVKVGWVEEPRL